MNFQVSGLSPEPFQPYFGLSDDELKKHGILRYQASAATNYTDRIEIRETKPGEQVLLLNHTCQPADTPYKSTHAIFVREYADTIYVGEPGEIPIIMLNYLQSLRGFTEDGMLIEADVSEGQDMASTISRLFDNPDISYIHSHNAKQGCYAGRIDRI